MSISGKGDRKTHLRAEIWKQSDQGSHVREVVDEEINISSHPVAEIGTGKSCAATKMARNL